MCKATDFDSSSLLDGRPVENTDEQRSEPTSSFWSFNLGLVVSILFLVISTINVVVTNASRDSLSTRQKQMEERMQKNHDEVISRFESLRNSRK